MFADSFGEFLRQLRKRAAMTQGDLAAATGYSVSFISSLECNTRRPDIEQIAQHFVPALGLHDEPRLAARLIELAASARGEKLSPLLQVAALQPPLFVVEEEDRGPTLPLPPAEMIGRNAEVSLLCKRLLGHRGRLLTLTGPPGVGKTRLALEIAERLANLLDDGVQFIPLATLDDAAQLAATIGTALGLTVGGKKAPDARLISHLRRKQMLLVLDNFEQLLTGPDMVVDPVAAQAPATALVAALLRECPDLQIIVTSRERLHLRAEQRHRVAPLDAEAAVELFIQRIQLHEAAANLTEADRPTLHAICQQLDCLPLAIELAAPRLDLLSPAALLAHVRAHRLDILVDGALDLPPRQRTLRAAIQSSYMLLTPAEQALFCDLAVFVGSFDHAAVDSLRYAPALLESLQSKSMLSVFLQHGAPRLALLETLREFALEHLAQSGREPVARQRHAAYYSELAHHAVRNMHGATKGPWLDRLEQEHDNLRAALQWTLDEDPVCALRLAVDLEEFWHLRGYGRDAERWLNAALDGNSQPTLLRAEGLLALAALRRRAGSYEPVASGLHEAEKIIEALVDPMAPSAAGPPNHVSRDLSDKASNTIEVRLKFYRCAGWYGYDVHDYQAALVSFQHGLALARAHDNSIQIVQFLTALAHIQRDRPELRSIVAGYLDECLVRLQHLDDPEALAFVMQQYGALETAVEQYHTAANYYWRMVEIFRPLRNKAELAWALELVAETAWFQDDLVTAQEYYAEAYALFVQLDNPDGIMITLHHLAQVARREGRCDEAQTLYSRSLRQAVALRNRHMTARNLAGLGAVALACARHEDAALLVSAAQQQFASLPPFLAPVDLREFISQTDAIQKIAATPSIAATWEIGQTTPPEQVALATLFKLGS